MAGAIMPSEAAGHMPAFFTPPGAPDWLLVVTGIFILAAVIAVGVFYLKLHHLPDHLAHRGQKVQYEIVSVLVLIAMFTHNNAYWIAALILALTPIPDFMTPLGSMARSLARMASGSGHKWTRSSSGEVVDGLDRRQAGGLSAAPGAEHRR